MPHTSATAKRLFLTRHAQAEHNVASDYTILDAPLTDLGRQQSRELHGISRDTFQQTAELLVSSCMRRPLETMLIGYPELHARLEAEGKPPVVLDILQEVQANPCDTPTAPVEKLKEWKDGLFSSLDFSALSPDYASKTGIFDPIRAPERAKRVRKWLRDRPEGEIVVVAHGDILRCIVDGQNSARPWANAEVKIFTFISSHDEEAALMEVDYVVPSNATNAPTSSEMGKPGANAVNGGC